jgi:hypothetical protein
MTSKTEKEAFVWIKTPALTILKRKTTERSLSKPFFLTHIFGSGGRLLTYDLRIMSQPLKLPHF